jgi:tetratricopeptide (TPR) repeat protein
LFEEERLIKKAEFELFHNNVAKTQQLAGRAAKLIPFDDSAQFLLARSAWLSNADPAPYFLNAIRISPQCSFWHRELAVYYFKTGKLKLADFEYSKAVELYPYKTDFLTGLAQVCRLEGDLSRADNYIRIATTVAGDQRPVLWELFRIKWAMGQKDRALKALDELAVKFNDPEAKKISDRIKSGK